MIIVLFFFNFTFDLQCAEMKFLILKYGVSLVILNIKGNKSHAYHVTYNFSVILKIV